MLIAALSDTHGLLRPEALAAIAHASHILHAGDVGDPAILETLARIAPLTAIRGNIDTASPCTDLLPTEAVTLAGHLIYLVHSLADLDLNPEAAGIALVLSGHSHKPSIEHRHGVLYLNPGSCGPRRFNLPVTLALIEADAPSLTPRIVHLLA